MALIFFYVQLFTIVANIQSRNAVVPQQLTRKTVICSATASCVCLHLIHYQHWD